jgi:hypothetical protein
MEILTLSQAKPKIGQLIDRALRGEPVLIRKGAHLVQLTEYLMPEPIPERPVGYFRRTPADYEIANRAPADPRPVR